MGSREQPRATSSNEHDEDPTPSAEALALPDSLGVPLLRLVPPASVPHASGVPPSFGLCVFAGGFIMLGVRESRTRYSSSASPAQASPELIVSSLLSEAVQSPK